MYVLHDIRVFGPIAKTMNIHLLIYSRAASNPTDPNMICKTVATVADLSFFSKRSGILSYPLWPEAS